MEICGEQIGRHKFKVRTEQVIQKYHIISQTSIDDDDDDNDDDDDVDDEDDDKCPSLRPS